MVKTKKDIGIFLIHGVTKTNKELELIGKKLNENNIQVCLPLLPGHGTCPYSNETCFKHFWATTPEQWMDYSEKEFIRWKKIHKLKRVYVGGISLGGNIAICLAAKYKVDGVILVGTPIFLSKMLSFTYNSSKIALWIISKVNKKHKRTCNNGQYHGLPIARLMRLKRFIDKSKEKLKLVDAPALIFHSKRDDVAHPKSVNHMLKNLGTDHKKVIWLETLHGVDINSKRHVNLIANKIAKFVKA